MIATPFLQAGGSKGQEAAIKRSNSLMTESNKRAWAHGHERSKSTDTTSVVEDLNQKIRVLQHSLEGERMENKELCER